MKKITISTATAQSLLDKLEVFKTPKNKVKLQIGVNKPIGGLPCRAVVVNGGMMAEIVFATTAVPKDFAEGIYFEVVVGTASLCSYLKALLAFQADIAVSFDESKQKLGLRVGNFANVALDIASEMDTLIDNEGQGLVMFEVPTGALLGAIKTGGYLVDTKVDELYSIKDRMALCVDGEAIRVYSSDTVTMSKAWCSIENFQSNDVYRASKFLETKTEALAAADKAEFEKQIQQAKADDKATLELAKREGYEAKPVRVALSATSISTLRSVFAGTEKLSIIITEKHLMVHSKNVMATFSLAGTVSSAYEKTVDPWEKTEWNAQLVLDKEAVMNAISIIRLGSTEKNAPFRLGVDKGRMCLADKKGNMAVASVVASAGALEKGVWLDATKLAPALEKLHNGNIVMKFFFPSNGQGFPVCLSNGDLEGKGTQCYIYVYPINMREDADATPKKEKSAEETATPAKEAAAEKSAETTAKKDVATGPMKDMLSADEINALLNAAEGDIPDIDENVDDVV